MSVICRVVEEWMHRYEPEKFFDEAGRFIPELEGAGPEGHQADECKPDRQ